MKIRRGDKVIVIAGKDRHKSGIVEHIITSKNRAIVAGVNIGKKTVKRSAQNPQGGIIELPQSIHLSNLMLLDAGNKPTRIGYKMSGTTKTRYSKTTGETVKETK